MAARAYSPRRGLHLGTDLETREALWLGDQWMRTGVHVLGRTGSGKTRLALNFFAQLAADDRAATIVLSPKGDLGPQCRDYAIAHGLSKRLVVFDPADREHVVGYNPLKPNGVDPFVQAHNVRQAILAGHGQTSIDRTQQLGRMLMYVLAAARLLELTFLEACELLRSDSGIRAAVLAEITDPVLARALAYFDSLRGARQDELAASALARLEAFTTFPILRDIVSQQARSLDLGEIMRERKILIINLEVFKPLPLDDVRILGRLLLNDLLAHAFARPKGQRTPVRVIIDECELFATETLCLALNMGRELGFVPILLHQELEQLVLDDDSRKLYAAVMNDTLVKIVSGTTTPEDLRQLADTLFLHDFDPMAVKDEIRSLESEPFQDWAMSRTTAQTWSSGTTRGTTRSRGVVRSLSKGQSRSQTFSHSMTHSRTETDIEGESFGESELSGYSAGSMTSQAIAMDSDGNSIFTSAGGTSSGSQAARGSTYARSTSRATSIGEAETAGEAETVGESVTEGEAQSLGDALSEGENDAEGGSESYTLSPITAYNCRRVVSSRAFWTYEEHIIKKMQAAGQLGVAEFIVKVPGKGARMFRAPFVRDPFASTRQRSAALARMHTLPYYARPEEIALEANAREQRLRVALPTRQRKQPPRRSRLKPGEQWDFELPSPILKSDDD